MPRKIIHLDLDAFFCAVEELHDPSLRGKPFAVGGRPDERGVVASCSYPARMYGVHSAMPMSRALLLCPQLIVAPGRHGVYDDFSHQVMSHCYDLTHLVEQISIDEAFLDVSDLRASAEAIARELQATIWNEHGLPCSLGVATNKLVAKIANTIGKAEKRSPSPPMAIKVVPPGEEAAFLAPLPVGELWGIGPKTAASLTELGITTIGDLARWPEADLVQRFGKSGYDLAQRARGLDDRPVVTEYEAKSLSRETTFARDVADAATLRRTLLHLAESVGQRLRRAGLTGQHRQAQAALGRLHHNYPASHAAGADRPGQRHLHRRTAPLRAGLAPGQTRAPHRRRREQPGTAVTAVGTVGNAIGEGAAPAGRARRRAGALRAGSDQAGK
jgi:DNA polymerase IV